jgi:hypothetical protein
MNAVAEVEKSNPIYGEQSRTVAKKIVKICENSWLNFFYFFVSWGLRSLKNQ